MEIMKTPVRFRHQKNRYRHSESFKYLLASFARICDLDFVPWCQNTACSPVSGPHDACDHPAFLLFDHASSCGFVDHQVDFLIAD